MNNIYSMHTKNFTFRHRLRRGNTGTMSVDVYNHAPVATGASYSLLHDTTLSGQVYGYDLDGDSITAQLVSGPTNGTVTLNPDGTFSYTPSAGFVGSDSFTFVWSDGVSDSNVATITVEVHNAPVLAAAGWDITMIHSQSVSLDLREVVYDADQEVLEFSLVRGPSYAQEFEITSRGTVRYKPWERWVGIDSFVFEVSDRASSAQSTVYISVINHHPVAEDDWIEVPAHEARIIRVQDLLANDWDVDNDRLKVKVDLESPQHGRIWFDEEAGFITYVPDPGFIGTDKFIYWVTDGVKQGPLSPGVLDEFLPEPENLMTTSNTAVVSLFVGTSNPAGGDAGDNSSQCNGGGGDTNDGGGTNGQPLEKMEVVIYTFIPAYRVWVWNPLALPERWSQYQYFRGDNRTFTADPEGENQYRTFQKLTLDVYDAEHKSKSGMVLDMQARTGETIEVDANDSVVRRGTGGEGHYWQAWKDLRTYVGPGARNYVINIEFGMRASNPLFIGPAPAIDYRARLQLFVNNTSDDRRLPLPNWNKHFWIAHDGFPNYEAYIRFNNGRWWPIFRYDHKDQTPVSLFGSGEFKYQGYHISWPLGNVGGGP